MKRGAFNELLFFNVYIFTSVDIFFAVSIAKRKELFNMNLPQ